MRWLVEVSGSKANLQHKLRLKEGAFACLRRILCGQYYRRRDDTRRVNVWMGSDDQTGNVGEVLFARGLSWHLWDMKYRRY